MTQRAVIGPGGGLGITYRRSGCMLARRRASVCDLVVPAPSGYGEDGVHSREAAEKKQKTEKIGRHL